MSRSMYSALLCVLISFCLLNIGKVREEVIQGMKRTLKVSIGYLLDIQTYLEHENVKMEESKSEVNEYRCVNHQYRIRLITRSPLIIYIEKFLTEDEIEHLIQLAKPLFQQSVVYDKNGKLIVNNNYRTSSTADLERHETPIVECIERRFAQFQGNINVENLEPLQVVQYTSEQEFKPHYDWFSQSDLLAGTGQRITTFFTYLYSNCSDGETEFLFLRLDQSTRQQFCDILVCDEQSGARFRPIAGNSIFWFNVDEQGKGDRYTYHAGRPPKNDGLKIGLNAWTHQHKVYTKKRP